MTPSPAIARSTAVPPALLAAGCILLAARTPGTGAVAVAAAAGMAGLVVPAGRAHGDGGRQWIACVTTGMVVFAVVRLAAPWPLLEATPWVVVASTIAAVAEEALFRRGMYGWLERFGPAVAVGTTAVAFALVHVPNYGWGVVPVDLGAGLVFGWQRWATRGWSAPAVTHVAANLLQMG